MYITNPTLFSLTLPALIAFFLVTSQGIEAINGCRRGARELLETNAKYLIP